MNRTLLQEPRGGHGPCTVWGPTKRA